ASREPIPLGVWVRITVLDQPDAVLFTYLDREALLHGRGTSNEADDSAVALPLPGMRCQALAPAEVDWLGLPIVPAWLEQCGPQPKPGTLWGWWRQHPKLQGRFHDEFPDDLRVLVHDSRAHAESMHSEIVWVRVIEGEGDVFTGRLLN